MPTETQDESTIRPLPSGVGGKAFRPIRKLNFDEIGLIDPTNKYGKFRRRQTNTPDAVAPIAGNCKKLLSISATESPIKQTDRTFSLVSISFTRDGNDKRYGYTRIWLRGYKGNTAQVMIADGRESPISFLLESTGENIGVYAQAIAQDATPTDLSLAPATTVLLDGVVSAPAAPTITQSVTSVALGFQFAYAQLSGLLADVVACYNIYRNTVNDSTTATKIDTKPHDPTALGSIVVQDYPGANLTYFYWVTAVNKAGLESTPSLAGTNSSLFVTNPNLAATHTSYRPLTNPLTASDAGANATVSLAAFTMRIGTVDVSISSGSITALSYNTLYYIYYDDPSYAGGAVSFASTTTKENALQGNGRFYVGSILTPKATGSNTIGNNDGGSGAQYGQLLRLSPSVGTTSAVTGSGSVASGTQAYDGDDTTVAAVTAPFNLNSSVTFTVTGMSTSLSASLTTLILKVKSSVTFTSDTTRTATLSYSTNSGGSFTNFYSVTNGARAVTTDTVTLTLPMNPSSIQVKAVCGGAGVGSVGNMTLNLYEIWCEATA